MSYLRGGLLCCVVSTLFVVGAACGGATATGIGDAPGTGTGNGTGNDAQVSGSDGSSSVDGGGGGGSLDTGIAKDGGGGPTSSDPGLVSCPPGIVKCTAKGATPPPAEYCCIEATTAGPIGTCKSEAVSACGGHRLGCDEKLDCAGNDLCCAEGSSSGPGGGEKVLTRCMPTCITGAPRIQVCKTDKECENGGPCSAYDCGDSIPVHLRFCEKPEGCK